jgi:hypothetical protein
MVTNLPAFAGNGHGQSAAYGPRCCGTQIAQFGTMPDSHCGDRVTGHIGGYFSR